MTSVDPLTNKYKTHLKSTTPTNMKPHHKKARTLVMVITHHTMRDLFLAVVRLNITIKVDKKRMTISNTKMILRL